MRLVIFLLAGVAAASTLPAQPRSRPDLKPADVIDRLPLGTQILLVANSPFDPTVHAVCI